MTSLYASKNKNYMLSFHFFVIFYFFTLDSLDDSTESIYFTDSSSHKESNDEELKPGEPSKYYALFEERRSQ